MVYFMEYYVDGGCRRNGCSNAIGAAAAVRKNKWGKKKGWTRPLYSNSYDPPTNQKAEITAVALALELALERFKELSGYPEIDVEIFSDSKYAIGCMTEWVYKWRRNGWKNAAGNPVANQDLIKEALKLEEVLRRLGTIKYTWVARSENEDADGCCNRVMDEME